MSVSQNNLNVNDSVELLSYIINVTPELRGEIDLPVQGQSISPIGKIIMGNPVYKNAFLNTINIIGKTVITRNHWENPWRKFTDKGTISYGQQVRDIIVDIANVYDYNEFANRPHEMLETEVPNVLSTIYEVNYQKFYKTTTSDEQMAMAFETGDLFSLIDEIVNSMFEGMEYDDFLVAKYILARRILDGTVTAKQIPNFDSITERDVVSFIKGHSNKMTFRKPDYNPAGIRKATAFDDQFAILDSIFEAKFSTKVLATSFFKDEADMRAHAELVDSMGEFDQARMIEIFGKRDSNGDIIPGEYLDGYVPLTDAELEKLAQVPCVIVGKDFFQNRRFGMDVSAPTKNTEFYNPQILKKNHFLHEWGIMATSPFENAVVFTIDAQGVSEVAINPTSATVSKGQSLQMSASVTTTGFANKAVVYSLNEQAIASGATINQSGKLQVPSDYVDESGTQGVYTFTISTALATGDKVNINGTEVTINAVEDDTATKQITAIYNALGTMDEYTLSKSSGVLTFTEKSGYYGTGAPTITVTKTQGSTGVTAEATTTEGKNASTPILVTATSVYDKTKSAQARITVS